MDLFERQRTTLIGGQQELERLKAEDGTFIVALELPPAPAVRAREEIDVTTARCRHRTRHRTRHRAHYRAPPSRSRGPPGSMPRACTPAPFMRGLCCGLATASSTASSRASRTGRRGSCARKATSSSALCAMGRRARPRRRSSAA
eukprot:scaffold40431_cov77-Phaeocystis_antarctica.AAC.1